MADSKLTSLSEISVPALTDLLYAVSDPGGTPASAKLTLARLLGLTPGVPTARLTTESGVPVSTSDRTAQSTLYWKPCVGGHPVTNGFVTTYDGTRRRRQDFTQVSLSLSGLTSGKNYDVFQKNSDLSLMLSNAWTNDTTRADAITDVMGLPVAAADNTYLWVGTIRATGTTTTEDSGGGTTTQVGGKRFVWNLYNQVPRTLKVIDTTDNWTYGTNAWRSGNNASGNRVEVVCGLASTMMDVRLVVTSQIAGAGGIASVALGADSTSSPSGNWAECYSGAGGVIFGLVANISGYAGLGYHYFSWLERAIFGTSYFYGDEGGNIQSGITGTVLA